MKNKHLKAVFIVKKNILLVLQFILNMKEGIFIWKKDPSLKWNLFRKWHVILCFFYGVRFCRNPLINDSIYDYLKFCNLFYFPGLFFLFSFSFFVEFPVCFCANEFISPWYSSKNILPLKVSVSCQMLHLAILHKRWKFAGKMMHALLLQLKCIFQFLGFTQLQFVDRKLIHQTITITELHSFH